MEAALATLDPKYYTGVQGTCDSPKFRDEGKVGSNSNNGYYYNMVLQGLNPSQSKVEPNPEVFETWYYGYWPYSAWGEYVAWWHNTY